MLGKNSTTDLHITHSLLFMDMQLYCFVFWAVWNNSTHPLTFCVDIVFRVWSCVLRTEQIFLKLLQHIESHRLGRPASLMPGKHLFC